LVVRGVTVAPAPPASVTEVGCSSELKFVIVV
jgi:hypothetical protein